MCPVDEHTFYVFISKVQNKQGMNDFPVTGDFYVHRIIIMITRGQTCKLWQRNVRRGVVSPLKAESLFLDIPVECHILL